MHEHSGQPNLRIYKISNNNNNFIIAEYKKKQLTFLVDTGADISICRIQPIFEDEPINIEDKCKLTGITTQEIHSLGTTELTLSISDEICRHTFHIVDDKFPIDTDGIIGRDFLTQYLGKIDYETFTLSLFVNSKTITLPMQTKAYNTLRITIPPRTQIIQPIKLNLTEDCVIFNSELKDGIFLSNSIAPKNGMTHIKLLNTTNETITLQGIKLHTDPLKKLQYIKLQYYK